MTPQQIDYGPNIRVVSRYRRPVDERPVHDTLEGVSEWLIDAARRNRSFAEVFDEFAWRLLAAGMPVLGLMLQGDILHPQFLGATYVWWRTDGQTETLMIEHEIAGRVPYEQNVFRRVREGGETMRFRLDEPGEGSDFRFAAEMKARGATEFFALPLPSPFGFGNYMLGYVTDRPGGFPDPQAADLFRYSRRLSAIADMNTQRQLSENLLRAYLGPQTGLQVLAGKVRRGSGEAISAVIWSSDLRGFTQLSDNLPGDRVIALLNDIFDLQAEAIGRHGGEILKFMGDGLLAIFPAPTREDARRAAQNALAAAREALAALDRRTPPRGEPRLRIVVALHYGSVFYGNIGAADRLDFTVIGHAVNLVARIEAVAKSLDLPLILSDDFVAVCGEKPTSIGMHRLRGLEQAHELFAP